MKLRSIKGLVFLFVYKIYVFIYLMLNKFKKKKLLILYLYANKNKYKKSYGVLQSIVRHIHGFEITIVKIDNFNEQKSTEYLENNVYDIAGDNSSWEFSGWGKGLRFVKEDLRIKNIDTVIFVNDAFLNYELQDWLYYLIRYNTLTLYNLKNDAVGMLDCSIKKVDLLGKDVSKWVRSNFLAVPYMVASEINLPCLSKEDIDKVIYKDFNVDVFKEGAPINKDLADFLRFWIAEGWPQAIEFNEQNWGIIRNKLVAIFNERFLSVQLVQHNLCLINSKCNYIFNLKSFLNLIFK